MDQAEVTRWTLAAELLDRLLELPREERHRVAAQLGRSHGVEKELEQLLSAARCDSMLDSSLEEMLKHVSQSVAEPNALKGQVVGHWVLGEEIGRGGMSVVYHASRTGQEFQQQAALKILSVAHLGDDFVASFVRERQILSDLHHPGIARLIDGGITSDGAPFLVMEHVAGERIDRWCELNGADVATVTRMVVRLCDAVAYAQRHLVVHQDINPANVLVDEHDRPVLIDFGIARLLRQSSRAGTLRAFTPNYAAPEQQAGDAITTATDVYALGALFRSLLKDKRIDRDLDAILRVATDPDPERRYANARALADDLRAWLAQRPVQARPPSVSYRSGRFIVRNRWGVAATALVTLSIIGGLAGALWQARIASAERDVAQAEGARALQVTEFLKDLFRASDPDRARGEAVSARELLDQGAHQVRNAMQGTPELKAEMQVLLGDLYRELGEFEAAKPLLEEGLVLADETGPLALEVAARRGLAQLLMEMGDHQEALEIAEQAEQLLVAAEEVPGRQHASLMQPILFSLAEQGRVAEAVDRGRAALALAGDHAGLSQKARFEYIYNVANVMLIAEQTAEAEALLLEAADIDFEALGDPSTQMNVHTNLAGVLMRKGELVAALEHYQSALSLANEIYPPLHPDRARRLSNLGGVLNNLGQHSEAESALREALSIYEQMYEGRVHPRVAAAHNNLGRALEEAGKYEAAEPHLSRAWEMASELFGAEDPRYAVATGNLGNMHRLLGNLDRAEDLLIENLELRRSILGPEHRAVGNGLALLAELRLDQGRPSDALQLCDEALALFHRIDHHNTRVILVTMTRRARALAALGRDEEAEVAFAEALETGEAAIEDAGQIWPRLLAAYAEYLSVRADPAAPAQLARALEVHRETLGPEHPSTLRIESRLADLLSSNQTALD